MKQPNLNYIAGNSPHIAPLPDCETKAFFSALLASIKELSEEERNNKTAVTLPESSIRKFYEQALLKEPQTLINLLIKEIVLYNDKMIVYYNNPIRTSPDGNSQGFSFYDGIAFMPYIIQNKPNPVMRAIRLIMNI